MSQILTAENFPQSNIVDLTALTSDAAAGQKIVNVENIGNIVVGSYCLLGSLGDERAQLNQVDTISGLAITFLTNLTVKHSRGEQLQRIRSNQIRFYAASNVNGSIPADGSFSVLTTQDIQADRLYTEYVHAAGGSDYWYKYTFYNSTTSSETDIADAVAVRGGNFGYYVSAQEVRETAGMKNNTYISDTLIFSKLQMAQSEVDGVLINRGYTLPLSSIPESVKNATLLIAAGYLLTNDYGPEFEGLNKDGNQKIKQGREILNQISSNMIQFPDGNGGAVAQNSGVRGYPDNTTANAERPAPFKFRVTDIY